MDERVVAVGLLGPLSVTLDGDSVELRIGRLRTLLAALAFSAGQAVSERRLSAALWDDDLPAHPRRAVQTYVNRLRSVVGAGLIRTDPSGYVLRVPPGKVDVSQFHRELHEAETAGSTASRRTCLTRAASLWRGSPFEGVNSAWLLRSAAPMLWERYLGALEQRLDIDIDDGRHQESLVELSDLTARFPLRESLWIRYLTLLDSCGRRSEALLWYAWLRKHVADELGTEPGRQLRRLHADLLADRRPPAGESSLPSRGLPVGERRWQPVSAQLHLW